MSASWNHLHTNSQAWFFEFVATWNRDSTVQMYQERERLHVFDRDQSTLGNLAFKSSAFAKSCGGEPRVTTLLAHRGTVTCLAMMTAATSAQL